MGDAAGLSVRRLSKRFGKFAALDDVSLEVKPGEFMALLGPSGSGKTSLLRAIAGLEAPDAGEIDVKGENFLAMSARERRVGMVFQHYALFRHMTVADNVAFGLKVRPARQRPARAEIKKRVEDLLELVQLGGLGKRFPAQLSGGQRQRVALARALAIEPRMLLLDEPFGALDAKVRKELRTWLRELHDCTGVTTLFVTHDQEEAMQVADRVAVLNAGRIEQVGAPHELEDRPASAFVFDFLGESNVLPCRVEGTVADFGGYTVPAHNPRGVLGQANARFRSHDVTLAPGQGHPATVIAQSRRQGRVELIVQDREGRRLTALLGADTPSVEPGAEVFIRPTRVFVFD